ncbi:hypothetical protein FFW73_01370 [Escherichia coli]|nr:hypothetical protein [Escherichia coli]
MRQRVQPGVILFRDMCGALPVVRKASWHCRQCHHDYYGEQYCTHCQTGGFSIPRTTQEEICEF